MDEVNQNKCTCPVVPTGTEYKQCSWCQEYDDMLVKAAEDIEDRLCEGY